MFLLLLLLFIYLYIKRSISCTCGILKFQSSAACSVRRVRWGAWQLTAVAWPYNPGLRVPVPDTLRRSVRQKKPRVEMMAGRKRHVRDIPQTARGKRAGLSQFLYLHVLLMHTKQRLTKSIILRFSASLYVMWYNLTSGHSPVQQPVQQPACLAASPPSTTAHARV